MRLWRRRKAAKSDVLVRLEHVLKVADKDAEVLEELVKTMRNRRSQGDPNPAA